MSSKRKKLSFNKWKREVNKSFAKITNGSSIDSIFKQWRSSDMYSEEYTPEEAAMDLFEQMEEMIVSG